MPAPRSHRRARLALLVSAALAITGFQFFLAPQAAQASVSAKISTFPYDQDWSTLTTTSTWADFPGVEGFTTGTTIAPQNPANTTDVGTLTAEGTLLSSLVARTGNTPNVDSNGGVLTYGNATNKTVALSATGSLTTPLLAFHLDTTGKSGVAVQYDLQDLDNGTDDQPTRVALQWRAGTTGPYTNVPAAYQTDVTVVSNPAVVTTHVGPVTLPAGADNQADLYLRVITIDNFSGSNEHVGIDNINITASSGPSPLALAPISDKTGTVGTPITGFSLVGTGGTAPLTYSATGLPANVSVDPSTGAVSGTPSAPCSCAVVAKVTDNAATEKTQNFTFDVAAFAVTNPGAKSFITNTAITPFSIVPTGGSGNYSYAVTGPNPLPAGLSLNPATGQVTGTPTVAQAATATEVTVTDTTTSNTASTTFDITVADVLSVATVQGTGARSTYAPANNATASIPANGQTVTTQGVVTAVYTKGFAASGAATCGFCGFYLQTGGPDGTPGASDAIFVYGNPGFTAKDSLGNDLAVGQSVRVTGTISEFASATDPATESTTELTAASATNIVPIAAQPAVVPQTTLPLTYAQREEHEGEFYAPTDLVITDTFNFESFGELGLSSGNDTLQQPNEACVTNLPSTPACIAAAQADIQNRGWFTEDGTSTSFLGSHFFDPQNSLNSDIPLPYITKTKSARVGAHVTFPAGGVLDFRNKKWYVQVPRAVSSTHNGATDLGADVLTFEDTRLDNLAPANVGGDMRIATYNVENFFTKTGKQFEIDNPHYACQYDTDRTGDPILTFQCTAPDAVPSTFDPVTNAPLTYHSGLVNNPRGAGNQASLDRQTAKIVKAINGLGADVVSLEELENPNKIRKGVTNGPLNPDLNNTKDQGLGTPLAWRDEAISYLVDKLNDAAGAGTWGFAASPAESTDATSVNHMCATKTAKLVDILPLATAGTCSWASGQDVIRSGFIYKTATVVPVGQSNLDLPNLNGAPAHSPFDNAREPLAQFFKPVGHPNTDGFAVIVNHFKSKGDADSGDGGGPAAGDNTNDPLLGAFNGDRTRQAGELLRFANWFADKWGTDKVFLVGDFNAYTGEPPVQTIINDPDHVDSLDFTELHSDDLNDTTYDFTTTVNGVGYGGTGSLDHVFASAGALGMVTGRDTWEINANEPGAYNYSRFNTNKTDFWDPNVPFGGSDHNPFVIGINTPSNANPTRDIQIIGTNDFHGRLLGDASDGGAAQLAGAVKSLKNTYGDGNSVFVSGGDNVGASIFESFIAEDKPTIDALNAAGLEFSSIGNHEFDKGWQDLTDRIMQPESGANPHGGAAWEYLGANVVHDGGPNDGDPIVAPWAVKDFGDTGVGGDIKVGFIGGVTNDLPGLVSPSSLTGVQVDPLVASINNAAADLKAAHSDVDLIVLLVHEGAANTDCSQMLGAGNAYADLLNGIDPSIDAVLSGHTHLEYSCSFPVVSWLADMGHPIKNRPVMQAASYGLALDQLVYSFDSSHKPVSVVQNNVNVKGAVSTLFNYPEDPAVKAIVDQAVADAAGPGAAVLGQITGPFKRARLGDGVTENRGGESTLGNQIAEMQRWATQDAQHGSAQIAFMNPGGLRADLIGNGGSPSNVTYRQAADVQPFANELINKQMTGAQIRAVLEQQWQRDLSGNVPSRPFLRLGSSAGFTYTYTESADPAHVGAKLGHVTGMWLDGVPLADATSYSVTMNGFLADGGDNFTAFTAGTDTKDTALSDLQAQVSYMAVNAQAPNPLPVDYGQRAVKVTMAGGSPATYDPGDPVSFDLSSLAMTAPGDATDSTVKVTLNGNQLGGTFNVDNSVAANQPYDEAGTASVTVNLPGNAPAGPAELHVIGNNTGTDVIVPITIDVGEPATHDIQILGINDFHGRIANDPTTGSAGAAVIAGAVKQFRTANPDTVFAAAGDLIGASTFESFIDKDKPTIDALNAAGLDVSSVGNHEFDQGSDDLINRVMNPAAPKGDAHWKYLAANIRNKTGGAQPIPATWTKDFGSVKVGFIGAVTNHLPELVSPAGISTIDVTPIVTEVNASATALDAAGADLIVLLVHEGAAQAGAAACTGDAIDPASDLGKIVAGIDPKVDAIISGHTHLEYDCDIAVPAWQADPNHPVKSRPVVSAGSYGVAMNKLNFSVDTATGSVLSDTHSILKMKNGTSGSNFNYPEDPATKAIVDAAVTAAGPLGAVTVGKISAPLYRGKLVDGTTENRGQESTLGNQVAEAQKDATKDPAQGGAVLAFMNPGGLRQDLLGTVNGGSREVSYRQAADVQPFGNTLVNMNLTGAQIKTVLQQQWQAAGAPRPFLKLGISKGFTYTYVPPPTGSPAGTQGTVTQMWLNGVLIDPLATYSVTVNSFLASGGDGFLELNNGTQKHDVGQVDLQAFVNYMGQFDTTPLQVDFTQRAVGVTFPVAAPAGYAPGDHVKFDVSSFAMTGPGDTQDTQVQVKLGATVLGSFNLTNTAVVTTDEAGKASVDVVVPNTVLPGPMTLTLVGAQTGTQSQVTVNAVKAGTTSVTAADFSVEYGQAAPIQVTVSGPGLTPTGTVTLMDGANPVATGSLDATGKVLLTVPALTYPVGQVSLSAVYGGDAQHNGSNKALTLTTTKATSTTTAGDTAMEYGQPVDVTVNVGAAAGVAVGGTVDVKNGATTVASAAVVAGVATVTLPAKSLEVGAASLTASYSGNANVKPSDDTFTVTVDKADSVVVAPDVAVAPGGTGSVSVTVSAVGVTPTGTVTVKNGATELGTASLLNGVAQLTLPALPNGTSLTASYSGDEHVKPGSDPFTVTCCDKSSPILAVSDVSMEFGQAKTATVTVTGSPGGSASGTVAIKNGATTLGTGTVSNGVAAVTIPAGSLPVGATVLTAEYSGDATLLAGAKAFTATVTKASSSVSAKVKPKHPKVGHKVKLKLTVVGANGVLATGQVTVKCQGKTFTGTLKNGHVTVKVGNLKKAVVKAIATYAGDSNVAGSQIKVKIKAS